MVSNVRESVRILVVLADDAVCSALQRILSHSTWTIQVAAVEQAAAALRTSRAGVLVTGARLSARLDWKDMLRETERLAPAPRLIVTDRLADEALWAELLNLGGYDLLMQPLNPEEVFRVLSLAWLSWKDAGERHKAALGHGRAIEAHAAEVPLRKTA